MAQVLHNIESEPASTIVVVVHITETLGDKRRKELVAALGMEDRIISAEFCPLHSQLMLVRYDRNISSSQDVLSSVKSQKYDARLIGPI